MNDLKSYDPIIDSNDIPQSSSDQHQPFHILLPPTDVLPVFIYLVEQTNNFQPLRHFLLLLAFAGTLASCSTRLLVTNDQIDRQPIPQRIMVIPNDSSRFFPAAMYPSYQTIDNHVTKVVEAFYPIDSLICVEFRARGIDCSIAKENEPIALDAPQITYKDYWTWDFTDYMHLLKMNVYKSDGSPLMEIISQGNTAGMHSYPKPKKQVPKMVDEIIEKGFDQ